MPFYLLDYVLFYIHFNQNQNVFYKKATCRSLYFGVNREIDDCSFILLKFRTQKKPFLLHLLNIAMKSIKLYTNIYYFH